MVQPAAQQKAYWDAFRTVFEENKAMVFSLCLRLLGNRQEAEDLTQEVFLNAYRSFPHFRKESKTSTWLYSIAINLWRNELRRKKFKKWLSLDFLSEEQGEKTKKEFAGGEDEPVAVLEKKEIGRIVQKAIDSLPERQRVALILQHYEGLVYEEIAKAMGISLSSVESLLFRAKQNLQKRLLPYLEYF